MIGKKGNNGNGKKNRENVNPNIRSRSINKPQHQKEQQQQHQQQQQLKKTLQDEATKQNKNKISNAKSSKKKNCEGCSLSLFTCFNVLFTARLIATLITIIDDCDETYNYTEPLHYLIFGNGFQTWEYSPIYAIRSYAYLWLNGGLAWLANYLFTPNKVFLFYFIRFLFALVSTCCELYFYSGVSKRFGNYIAYYVLIFGCFASGMMNASVAFLPNTFSMYMVYLAYGAYYRGSNKFALASIALSVLIGWPFSGIVFVPILLHLLFTTGFRYFKFGIVITTLVLVLMEAIDSYYYGKFVVAPLNIVKYNIFTSHGADLYGTEPIYYYLYNLVLNFNIVFIASVLSFPVVLLHWLFGGKDNSIGTHHVVSLLGLLWSLLAFVTQEHKEGRFMYPLYPLIILSAAFTFNALKQLVENVVPVFLKLNKLTNWTLVLTFIALSVSRSYLLYTGYYAPIDTYTALGQQPEVLSAKQPINVCVGKEWHRFPSNFFMPAGTQLRFLTSEFRGQLPQPFDTSKLGSRVLRGNFNDLNKEEVDRYHDVNKCHYVVDSDYKQANGRDVPYSKDSKKWKIVNTVKMLDATLTESFWRAFYVPILSEEHIAYVNYNILKNVNLPVV